MHSVAVSGVSCEVRVASSVGDLVPCAWPDIGLRDIADGDSASMAIDIVTLDT
jgi:hypothetical protein